jgi:acyl-CoA reductase-like NAD-dependent aldehyde dehydrogenase
LLALKNYDVYVNGEFVHAESASTVDVVDPATGDLLARVPDANAADVAKAVAAARAAFDAGAWKDTTAQDRGRVLFKLAEIVRQRVDELADLETRTGLGETGAAIVDAMVEKARTITVGPPLDRDAKMGALVSREQFDRVREYQEIGKREAKVAVGGGTATVQGLDRGLFVEPTIFYDVDNADRIAVEEYLNVKQVYINLSEQPIGWY